jgi:hypothetical protein
MTDDDDLRAALERALPASLDDIVSIGRDTMSVAGATQEDLEALVGDVGTGVPTDILDGWYPVAIRERSADGQVETSVHMVGWSRTKRVSWITSPVRAADYERGCVRTQSGTLYGLGERGDGEPSLDLLLLVCRALWVWGVGERFGVPKVTMPAF